MMHPAVIRFNKVFSDYILGKCQGKRVLLTMSGGLDTRAILSVLWNHDVFFDSLTFNTEKRDMWIAKKILRCCPLVKESLFWSDESNGCELRTRFIALCDSYDIVLNGYLMSGYFDQCSHVEMSEQRLTEYLQFHFDNAKDWMLKNPKMCFPATDEHVRTALLEVPLRYRYFGYLQRCIIMLNRPGLMSFGYTSFNLRTRVARLLYWTVMKVIR